MAVIEIAKIQVRRGQENQTGVPRLDPGEFGWAQDTQHLYIGKRIAEGANSDENTRLLTELDLAKVDNIFALLNGKSTAASTSTYKYREGVAHIASTVTTIGLKLDEQSPSLLDYEVIPSFTATDITTNFKNAVNNVFYNSTVGSFQRYDARRRLIIPAGNYLISNVIDLPPYTTLIGQGPGITTLTLVSTNTNMFRTVDANGDRFESSNMKDGSLRSRDVHIQGMTIQYSNTTTSTYALLSLDNAYRTVIDEVHFRTSSTVTATNYGVGIKLRGTGGGLGSGEVNLHEYTEINRCTFENLNLGIEGTGTVIRPVMENNIFKDLQQGIKLYSTDTRPGPSNGLIKSNRFESIAYEAIYVGENPNRYRTDHVSENNYFVKVGNGLDTNGNPKGDFTTSTQTSIIAFYADGNKSENDYFYRKTLANTTTNNTFYYNPIVKGRSYMRDASMFTATISTSTIVNLMKFAVNGGDQMIKADYQIYNEAISRKGSIVVNLTPDGSSNVVDTYTYSEGLYVATSTVTTSTGSTINLLVVNTATHPAFNQVIPSTGKWYITGSNTNSGKICLILDQYDYYDPNTKAYIVQAQSAFDFALIGETYTLLQQDSTSQFFTTLDSYSASKNYVILQLTNTSILAPVTVEYQTDVIT